MTQSYGYGRCAIGRYYMSWEPIQLDEWCCPLCPEDEPVVFDLSLHVFRHLRDQYFPAALRPSYTMPRVLAAPGGGANSFCVADSVRSRLGRATAGCATSELGTGGRGGVRKGRGAPGGGTQSGMLFGPVPQAEPASEQAVGAAGCQCAGPQVS